MRSCIFFCKNHCFLNTLKKAMLTCKCHYYCPEDASLIQYLQTIYVEVRRATCLDPLTNKRFQVYEIDLPACKIHLHGKQIHVHIKGIEIGPVELNELGKLYIGEPASFVFEFMKDFEIFKYAIRYYFERVVFSRNSSKVNL